MPIGWGTGHKVSIHLCLARAVREAILFMDCGQVSALYKYTIFCKSVKCIFV